MTVRSVHMVLPKEHGAWAILLLPYSSGAIIAGSADFQVFLGLSAVFLLFISRPPLMTLIKRKRIDGTYGTNAPSLAAGVLIPSTLSLAIFLWIMAAYGLWCLLLPGFLGVLLFSLHMRLALGRHERVASAELAGIAMLALAAPVAWCLVAGSLNRNAWVVYLLNVAYFGASVFYVKMRLRASRRVSVVMYERLQRSRNLIIYIAVMLALVLSLTATGLAPSMVLLAYLPLTAYLIWNIVSTRVNKHITVEGIMQTGLATVFTILIVASYRL